MQELQFPWLEVSAGHGDSWEGRQAGLQSVQGWTLELCELIPGRGTPSPASLTRGRS